LSLLAHASIPLKFWDEPFLAATYLINILPSKVINDNTPLECLFNQKLDYSFLRTFSCACWPHLRWYNSHKLQFRSKQCVFLRYNDLHKGYTCLDISTGRVYISRDVIFDEENFPFSNLHPNAGARLKSEIALLDPTLFPHNCGATTILDHVSDNPTANEIAEFTREIAEENPASIASLQEEIQLEDRTPTRLPHQPESAPDTTVASTSASNRALHSPTRSSAQTPTSTNPREARSDMGTDPMARNTMDLNSAAPEQADTTQVSSSPAREPIDASVDARPVTRAQQGIHQPRSTLMVWLDMVNMAF
jgi:hypothetical protein